MSDEIGKWANLQRDLKRRNTMDKTKGSGFLRCWQQGLILVVMVAVLTACAGVEASSAPASVSDEGTEIHTGTALDTSYEGALPVNIQLALGTMRLEGTGNAVTPEQARALLPLWQAIQGGTLKGDEEMNAVLGQIEGKMTSEQSAVIAAMQLTQDDIRAWAKSQGLTTGTSPEGRGASGDQSLPDGAPAGPRGAGGQRPNLSPEQIEAMRTTVEAGGGPAGGRGTTGGIEQIGFVAEPLIKLLAQRAAE